MRDVILRLGVLAALLSGASAHAQGDDTPVPPPPHATASHPAHLHRQGQVKMAPAAKPVPTAMAAPKAPAAPPPKVPVAAPPPPVLPPPTVVPLRPMPPPPPASVVTDAAGLATPLKDGLRVTFGAGSSDLNPATDAALRTLVHDAPPFASTTFTVVAVAQGVPEDPSTPRRLSLARALAVRSVLITEGVASTRIYVKAMGASALAIAGGPPDRVDVSVGGTAPAGQAGSGSMASSALPGAAAGTP